MMAALYGLLEEYKSFITTITTCGNLSDLEELRLLLQEEQQDQRFNALCSSAPPTGHLLPLWLHMVVVGQAIRVAVQIDLVEAEVIMEDDIRD